MDAPEAFCILVQNKVRFNLHCSERNLSSELTATKVKGESREEDEGHRQLHGPDSDWLYGWIGEWFWENARDLGILVIFWCSL